MPSLKKAPQDNVKFSDMLLTGHGRQVVVVVLGWGDNHLLALPLSLSKK